MYFPYRQPCNCWSWMFLNIMVSSEFQRRVSMPMFCQSLIQTIPKPAIWHQLAVYLLHQEVKYAGLLAAVCIIIKHKYTGSLWTIIICITWNVSGTITVEADATIMNWFFYTDVFGRQTVSLFQDSVNHLSYDVFTLNRGWNLRFSLTLFNYELIQCLKGLNHQAMYCYRAILFNFKVTSSRLINALTTVYILIEKSEMSCRHASKNVHVLLILI